MNLEKLAEQVPALVVLASVVILFLKSQSKRDDAFFQFMSEQSSKFKALGDDCHRVQTRATEVISENTKMYGRLEKALEQAVEKIQSVGVERRKEEAARR